MGKLGHEEPHARRQHGAEALLGLSQLALDRMEQGVCVYDADNRIVLVNRRYIEMFGMSPDIVRPGTPYRDVLAHSASRRQYARGRDRQFLRQADRADRQGREVPRSSAGWRTAW